MKAGNFVLYAFLSILFLVVACSNEKPGDFKKVGELISDRNSARYSFAGNKRSKSKSKVIQEKAQPSAKKDKIETAKGQTSSAGLVEEKIQIIGASSKKPLAKGLAYLNENGQIVRIKIFKEE